MFATKPFHLVQVTESRVTRRNLGGSTTSSTSSSTPTPTLESLAAALEGTDPLTQFAHQEMDPLSKMAADMVCTWNLRITVGVLKSCYQLFCHVYPYITNSGNQYRVMEERAKMPYWMILLSHGLLESLPYWTSSPLQKNYQLSQVFCQEERKVCGC